MDLLRIDLVDILDVSLTDDQRRLLRPMEGKRQQTRAAGLAQRLKESSEWIFYPEQLAEFALIDFSRQSEDSTARGAVLRLSREQRYGTYITWKSYGPERDPLWVKQNSWSECAAARQPLFEVVGEISGLRHYPFIALRANASDVDRFCGENAEQLGKVFTGDYEDEPPGTLKNYINDNVSHRSYEKFLTQWTEALAVYSSSTSENHYELSFFRAVQIFEHWILARNAFSAITEQLNSSASTLFVVTWPQWNRVHRLLAQYRLIEQRFIIAPLVQSVEADRLIEATKVRSSLSRVISGAESAASRLQDQFQWAKAQTLGLIALITFLLDKFIGWENVRIWLWQMFKRWF